MSKVLNERRQITCEFTVALSMAKGLIMAYLGIFALIGCNELAKK